MCLRGCCEDVYYFLNIEIIIDIKIVERVINIFLII